MQPTSPSAHITQPTKSPKMGVSDPTTLGGLYEHRTRPEWGLATRIAHDGERTAYQFEDGKLRKIALSHAHLLDEVDRPRDESERLQRELAAKAGLAMARRNMSEAGDQLITLDQQVRLFLSDFEGGFRDPSYVRTHRGSGLRFAKRHRDPAIAKAQELLGRGAMLELIVASRHDVVMERVIELLESTSLVDKRQIEPLKALDERAMHRAVAALSELLYGDVEMALPMQRWIDALATAGKGVSWSLATALLALVQPHKHMCVRETVLSRQARWMAPRLRMTKVPNGKIYSRLCTMALNLAAELEARDLAPRDLLDVYELVWLTLRPAARKRIAAMPPAPLASHTRSIATSSKSDAVTVSDMEAA